MLKQFGLRLVGTGVLACVIGTVVLNLAIAGRNALPQAAESVDDRLFDEEPASWSDTWRELQNMAMRTVAVFNPLQPVDLPLHPTPERVDVPSYLTPERVDGGIMP
jgi:hypothetical protein